LLFVTLCRVPCPCSYQPPTTMVCPVGAIHHRVKVNKLGSSNLLMAFAAVGSRTVVSLCRVSELACFEIPVVLLCTEPCLFEEGCWVNTTWVELWVAVHSILKSFVTRYIARGKTSRPCGPQSLRMTFSPASARKATSTSQIKPRKSDQVRFRKAEVPSFAL